MTLLVTFPPNVDESGHGYYRRLAEQNALSSWRELARFAEVRQDRNSLLSSTSHVSSILGLDEASVAKACAQEARLRAWRFLSRLNADAVCPLCLVESSYIRHYWENAYATCCPKHNIRLIDRCDACGKTLKKGREALDYCSCGHDLRDSVTTTPTKAELWLSALIESDGVSTGGVAPEVKSVPLQSLMLLVRDLCLSIDPTVPPPRRTAGTVKTISRAVELLAPLDALLKNWPVAFEEHVTLRLKAGKPKARTLNMCLGQWYKQLKILSQDNDLEQFLRVVIRVAAEKFNGVLGLDSAAQLAAEATGYVRIAEGAEMLGVSHASLRAWVIDSVWPKRSLLRGTRGVTYEIRKADIQMIAQTRAGWIKRKDAAQCAGITDAVLSNMIKADVINSDVHWRDDILKGGEIEACSLDQLYRTLLANLKPYQNRGEKIIFWADLKSRRWGSNQGIQSTMQAAQRGDLVPVVSGPTLGKLGFLQSEVAQYFGTPVIEAGMTMTDLMKATGWKSETIRHWVDEGLLKHARVNQKGKERIVLLPEHLLEFGRTYIPLADLAKSTDTKASALARTLDNSIELVGALTLPNGNQRGSLVRISDLARLAFANGVGQ